MDGRLGGVPVGEIKEKELHYSDILLQPRQAIIDSRLEADTSLNFGGHLFALPIVPANMKTVINEALAIWLAENGYFYIHHRFGVDPIPFVKMMNGHKLISSISLGVNEDSMKFVHQLADNATPDYITVDVAHGHCYKMEKMIKHIKKYLPKSYLIAGNVCTQEGARFLWDAGADAIKVGIGSGKVCTTKLMTGFSRPQFSAILDVARAFDTMCHMCHSYYPGSYNREQPPRGKPDDPRCGCGATLGWASQRQGIPPIIADGGVEYNGDIAKALVAGATMVMAGGLLAGMDESPGKKVVHDDGRITKEYFGSASEHNKGAKEFVEGRRIEIPYRGSITDKLLEIKQSLRSSISYAGGSDLKCFRTVDWVRQ